MRPSACWYERVLIKSSHHLGDTLALTRKR